MALRTLASLGSLDGKRVIVRCDFNVPIKDGQITDDGRIVASLPTLRALLDAGASVVVCSHLGRPEGAPDARYSLAPAAKRLGELIDVPVFFAADDAQAQAMLAEPQQGTITVLENVRFSPLETSKDAGERKEFAAHLAQYADAFVSDGFGVVHRRQASVYELAEVLPSAAGLLVAAEVEVLERLTSTTERPYTVVLGGSKVSDKLGVISHLLPKVDRLLIGGGMLFTFLAAKGHKVASSLLEADMIDTVREYLAEAERLGVEVVLPSDVVVAESFAADARSEVTASDAIEETAFGKSGIGLDIGPDTAARFAELISSSRSVFWNGPMGVFEFPAFAAGTRAVADALTRVDGLAVVGGGDSAAAVRQLGFDDSQFGHISTGGGASLEFLEGKSLPGLEVLGWRT